MLSFELSEEQQMIRDTVGAFAREQIRPAGGPADEAGEIPPALVEQAWQLGLVQGPIPEALGGNGDTRLALTGSIVAEELAWGDLAIAAHVLAPRLLAFPVLAMGTDEQRERHLRRFAGREFVPATAALMEPRWDFDPMAMSTVARRDGAGFVLDGSKCLVPLAAESETLLVWAAAENHDRVEGFLLPRTSAGLSVGERERNMGLQGLATYEVALDARRVRLRARLRQGAQGLWRSDRDQAGGGLHARRHGDRDRRRAPAGMGSRMAARPRRGCAQGELPRAQLRRGDRAQGDGQRGPGARRPRLYPRASGRDVAAQRARIINVRGAGNRLSAPDSAEIASGVFSGVFR